MASMSRRLFPWDWHFVPVLPDASRTISSRVPGSRHEPLQLCNTCRRVIAWACEILSGDPELSRQPETLEAVWYHDSRRELEANAARGCALCSSFYYAVESTFKASQRAPPLSRLVVGLEMDEKDRPTLILEGVSQDTKEAKLSPRKKGLPTYPGTPAARPEPRYGAVVVRLARVPSQQAGPSAPSQNKPTNAGSSVDSKEPSSLPEGFKAEVATNSSAHFQLARHWLQDCLANHANCQARSAALDRGFLPTRLIQIRRTWQDSPIFAFLPDKFRGGSVNDLSLVETNAINKTGISYMTLSYCWGSSRFFALSRKNKAALEQGFSSAVLPQTLRDVLYVAWQLGCQYVWIDSLCIVQDDRDDWAREASMMKKVYENSTLTIAALGAKDCQEGLFTQRDPLTFNSFHLLETKAGVRYQAEPFLGSLPQSSIGGESNSSSVAATLHGTRMYSPLHGRAWVFQERLLSQRTLNYGSILSWDCHTKMCHELDPAGALSADDGNPYDGHDNVSKAIKNILQGDKDRNATIPFKALTAWRSKVEGVPPGPVHDSILVHFWHTEILVKYCKLEITKPGDRLPALGGVIESFSNSTSWRNYFGIWAPHAPELLLWHSAEELPGLDKARVEGVPTWSWASIGRVFSIEWAYGVATAELEPEWFEHIERADVEFLEDGKQIEITSVVYGIRMEVDEDDGETTTILSGLEELPDKTSYHFDAEENPKTKATAGSSGDPEILIFVPLVWVRRTDSQTLQRLAMFESFFAELEGEEAPDMLRGPHCICLGLLLARSANPQVKEDFRRVGCADMVFSDPMMGSREMAKDKYEVYVR